MNKLVPDQLPGKFLLMQQAANKFGLGLQGIGNICDLRSALVVTDFA